jgi:citrate lyase beta subunit
VAKERPPIPSLPLLPVSDFAPARPARPFHPFELGASLYVPATRPDLLALGSGEKLPHLRSLIYCTEDSIHAADLPDALARLGETLPHLGEGQSGECGPLRFVRPRDPRTLEALLALPGAEHLHGFVLPKLTARNALDYLRLLGPQSPFSVMATVETREVFGSSDLENLRELLLGSGVPVAAVRFGGNDLLSLLGLRRVPGLSAYETPLCTWIDRVVGAFVPWGIAVSAPVYEWIDDLATLERETRADVQRGLSGKTAIHPAQIEVIERAYRVSAHDLEQARAILHSQAPAVFRLGGGMCEPATHTRWAQAILRRADVYGALPGAWAEASGA